MQLAAALPDRPGETRRFPLAVHLVLWRNEELLLLRRFNTGYRDGYYALPAGRVETGESAMDAVLREAQEETGLVLSAADLTHNLTMHRFAADGYGECVDLFFAAARFSGQPVNAEPHKCDDAGFFRRDRLPELMVPYHAVALTAMARGERYTEFGWTG